MPSRNIGSDIFAAVRDRYRNRTIKYIHETVISGYREIGIQTSDPTTPTSSRTSATLIGRLRYSKIKEQEPFAWPLHHSKETRYSVRKFGRDGTMDSSTDSLPPGCWKSFISFWLIPLNHHRDYQEKTHLQWGWIGESNGLACHALEVVRRTSER